MPLLVLGLKFDPSCLKGSFHDEDRFRHAQRLVGEFKHHANQNPKIVFCHALTQSDEIVIDKYFDPIGAFTGNHFKGDHFVNDVKDLSLMEPFDFDDGIHKLPLVGNGKERLRKLKRDFA